MTPRDFITVGIMPGLSLLPPKMDTPSARAMLLAIALQESGLVYRKQKENGPARGFLQFERGGGVHGVLTHPSSRDHALAACRALTIAPFSDVVWAALEYSDALAVVFGRLLLWTDPGSLPDRHGEERAWSVYLRTWRPGKPHRHTFPGAFGVAWEEVDPAPPQPRRFA